jgi:hypothetical protein
MQSGKKRTVTLRGIKKRALCELGDGAKVKGKKKRNEECAVSKAGNSPHSHLPSSILHQRTNKLHQEDRGVLQPELETQTVKDNLVHTSCRRCASPPRSAEKEKKPVQIRCKHHDG